MTAFSNYIGGSDIKWWDGVTRTFTRLTSTGGLLSQNKIGSAVDILEVFGNGTDYTYNTLKTALGYIGSNNVTILLQPGTWTITEDLTINSNFRLWAEKGVTLNISSGKTLTLNCSLPTLKDITFTGSGTVVISHVDQTITADAAINQGMETVSFDTTAGAIASTLGSGILGQIITMVLTTDGGYDVTLTITNHKDGDNTVFTFEDKNDTLIFIWNGSKWHTLYDDRGGNFLNCHSNIMNLYQGVSG